MTSFELLLPASPMLTLPISSGRTCHMFVAGLRGRSAILSTGGEMYSLNLPLIRLRAVSQRLGDGGLTGRVTVLEGNGDDAFLFWATCSTGTSMVTGGSTGAAGRRVDPVVDDRGVDVCVGNICLGPVLVVLVGEEAGLRLPDGPATGGLATSFGPPWTSLEAPGWAGGGTKDGTAAGSLACRFWFPLSRPWRAWLLPSRPLPPPCLHKLA